MIASSTLYIGNKQIDGRFFVTENHLLDDGRILSFEYLSDINTNNTEVMHVRASIINKQLEEQTAIIDEASKCVLPLTKYQFRQLRTVEERIACDKFEATYTNNPLLTEEQIDTIRTYLRDYAEAQEVRLTHPSTISGVQLWESLGLISIGRAAEILNG